MLSATKHLENDHSWLRFIARQPILDTHSRILGYELLYRQGAENRFSGDGEKASRITLDNTILFGLDTLAHGAKIFVNCTRELLLQKTVTLLPPKSTVLEILETIDPEPEVICACIELRSLGYKIALDDFVFRPGMERFLAIADYIKVDFLNTSAEDRRKIQQLSKNSSAHLLAEKIETLEDFETARKEGYRYFQGYYFCRPAMMSGSDIPSNAVNYLALLHAICKTPFDFAEVELLVKREPSLCFRLLRLVNAASNGIRGHVTSVMTALMAIGEKQFRKLVSIAVASEMSRDQPIELLSLALTRARFCELAAPKIGLDPTTEYLLGLFSLIPSLLKIRMEDFLTLLPLSHEIASALRGESNRARRPLSFLEHYERGCWNNCDELCREMNMTEAQAADTYAASVQWAKDALGNKRH